MGIRMKTKLPPVARTLLALSLTLFSSSALADPKACITAHAAGQREAKAGHLRLATQLYTTCGSDETCPSQLLQECAELLRSVQQTMPTVIFMVIDEKGEDVSAVKVFSTDELIVDGLDGRAVQIDPGKHRLRLLLRSGEVLNSDVLIREGEKNRLIQVSVKGTHEEPVPGPERRATKPAPAPSPPPAVASSVAPAEQRTLPAVFWLASGAAVVGLGVGTTFAILGKSEKNTLSDCAPYCGADMRGTYDNLKRDYLVADIGFVSSAVATGVATWLFVSSRFGKGEQPASSQSQIGIRRLVPSCGVSNNGGVLSWSGTF